MDPIALIVAAVVAGASKGIGDEVASEVRALYQRLRERLLARFGHSRSAASALERLEEDPSDQDRRAELAEALRDHGAAEDDDTVALARRLARASGITVENIQVARDRGLMQDSQQVVRGTVPEGATARNVAEVSGDARIIGSGAKIDFRGAPDDRPDP